MSGSLLRKLKLRRRNPPPPIVVVPPQPKPNQQAQDIMFRAAAASRSAREIGSDLNGQRDQTRTSIETLALAGNYAQATIQVTAFETLVQAALDWHGRLPELANVRNEAQRLSGLGDGPAGAALPDLAQAAQDANTNNFVAANGLLDGAAATVAKRTQAQPLIAQAAGHAARASQAGLDLAGQRDTLQQEIVTLANTDQSGQAAQKLAAFGTLVDEALVWHGRALELTAARSSAQRLKTGGDPTADTLLGELGQADTEAAANRYPAAGVVLDTAGPKIAARENAWSLIVSANAANSKAEQAGIDLGGQRETLRKEVVDLAEAGQISTASTKAVDFTALVDGAIAWGGRANELQGARAAAQRLKSEGDTKADEALTDLTSAEGEANANRFPAANGLLDSGKLKSEQRAQAWPVIVRANAAAKKAEDAGLDFNNTRETQRLEIVGLADSNQFSTAESKTTAFEKLVDGAIAWPTRKGDIDKARAQAELLKSGGDPTADGLLAGLKAAEDEATAGRYAQAMTLLDPAIQAITARAPIWKLLRTHTVEMTKLKPRLGVTTAPTAFPAEV